jgi:hypothetical protein
VMKWLDLTRDGSESHEDERKAFAIIANLPRRVLVVSFSSFAVPAVLSVFGMFFLFDDFKLYNATLMLIAILSGAALTAIVEGFLFKRWLVPLRSRLAGALDNPMERSELTEPLSLVTKLQTVILVCTLIPVIFVGLVGQTRSSIPVEELVHVLHDEVLAETLEIASANPQLDLIEIAAQHESGALATSLAVLDLQAGSVDFGDPDLLEAAEWASILEAAGDAGAGGQLDSNNLHAWQQSNDGRYALIVASPREGLVGTRGGLLPIFIGLVVGCVLLALGIGWLVAQEVGGATRRLGHAADRMASGDLRRSDVFESEDELGILGRAFDARSTCNSLQVRADSLVVEGPGPQARPHTLTSPRET